VGEGLPVVCTDVGGLRDLVRDGETGLLVPDEDVEAMSAAIVRLVRIPVSPAVVRQRTARGRALALGPGDPQWSACSSNYLPLRAAWLADAAL